MFRYKAVEFYKNTNKVFSFVRAIGLCSWKFIRSVHRIGCVTYLWTWLRIDINNLILGFHVEDVLSTWNFCQWVCQVISALSAASGAVTVGFFYVGTIGGWCRTTLRGPKLFFFCAETDGRMKQVFPALPTVDKIAVLAPCEVLPVVHSDVIKVVQTNGEFFPRIKKLAQFWIIGSHCWREE